MLTLLVMLLTTTTAWATTQNVSYVDASGTAQTPVEAELITSSTELTKLYSGWYVVTENTTCGTVMMVGGGTVNIILCDGATLSVETIDGSDVSRDLIIWGQTQGTGTLDFQQINSGAKLNSLTVNSGRLLCSSVMDGKTYAIFLKDTNYPLTVNGGEVSLAAGGFGSVGGSLAFNGGTLESGKVKGNTTLNYTSASDRVKISDFGSSVTVADGKYFKDASGNFYYGTLSDQQKNAIRGVTLTPATQTEFIQANLGTENDGSNEHPYTISDATGWNAFCDALQDNATWNRFSGKTVKLGNSIEVTRMAGGTYHDFQGTFDGQGHTLTFNYGKANDVSTESYVAPFRNVESGCIIENLHVAGDIYTSGQFAAGIICSQYGEVTIRNCRSSINIHSSHSGDGTHGGLVANNDNKSATLTIEGCVFDGSLFGTTTHSVGGFIGWRKGTANIYNSLFAPAAVTVQNEGSATFGRNNVDTYNCYYTTLLNDGTNYVPAYVGGTETPNLWRNGKATRTVAADTDVTIESVALTGDATVYNVSGITAYSGGGLQLGETLYYGSDDQLSLTLSNSATGAPQGYRYDGYTASAGTLSGTTLTMPDEDVTISVSTAHLASTGLPVAVAYVDADGTLHDGDNAAQAVALDGSEESLAAGTYFVGLPEVNFVNTLRLQNGDVTLILADNCHMNVGTSGEGRINDRGIDGYDADNWYGLTITSESLGDDMGALSVYTTGIGNYGIWANALTINGGHVTSDTNGAAATALYATLNDLTINSGTVTATAAGTEAHAIAAAGNFNYNGGIVTATGGPDANAIWAYCNYTFSWRTPADRITIGATGLYAPAAKTATFTRLFTDGDPGNYYGGTLTGTALNALKSVTLQPCDVATFAPEGYATYYYGTYDVTLPAGVKARIVTARGDSEGTLTYETIADGDTNDKVVPAGTAVMLQTEKSTEAQQKTLTLAVHGADSPAAPTLNLLHGSDVEGTTTGDGKHYKLTYGNDNTPNADVFGWYWGAENGAAFTSPAHKAWLLLPYDLAGARSFLALPDDDETTSLSEKGIVNSEQFLTPEGMSEQARRPTAQWYTLDGRKLDSKPTAKGIYVVNGRKFVIK